MANRIEPRSDIGYEMFVARRKKQMSRKALADELGVGVTSIANWENGRHAPASKAFRLSCRGFIDAANTEARSIF